MTSKEELVAKSYEAGYNARKDLGLEKKKPMDATIVRFKCPYCHIRGWLVIQGNLNEKYILCPFCKMVSLKTTSATFKQLRRVLEELFAKPLEEVLRILKEIRGLQ